MSERLNLGNIIEIQQIKSVLRKDKRLLEMFNTLLKIINKSVNNENLEEIIEDTDTEKSFSVYSDSSEDDI
tara:strand:+ start:4816 stop:5028 length:213 start_codon:yes stop_codon:yes gene_type:complete